MSGGVDSTCAALLMKDSGYDISGVMMHLPEADKTAEEDAQKACQKLGAKLFVLDLTDEFKKIVIEKFIDEYTKCKTPNPCIICNRYMKFGILADYAKDGGYDCLATGHYARIEKEGGRYLLKKATDLKKDQSYVLFNIRKEILPFVRFPLGYKTKDEARDKLETGGFLNAKRRDSQDICFIPDGKYAEFIEQFTKRSFAPGDFVDSDGNILGQHKGLIRYTIGQRKGLGLALPAPMYVKRLDIVNNAVVLGTNEDLYGRRLVAEDVNLLACDKISDGMKVSARARYSMKEQPAKVFCAEDGKIIVEFDSPQRAITPGQSVVLYDGDIVIGGGTIVSNR